MTRVTSRFTREVASVVRGLLAEHQISGARLAEALERAPSYVSERQTGHRAWTVADLEVIAELLDVDPMVLLNEVSRRSRLARDARDAAVLGKPGGQPPRKDGSPAGRSTPSTSASSTPSASSAGRRRHRSA